MQYDVRYDPDQMVCFSHSLLHWAACSAVYRNTLDNMNLHLFANDVGQLISKSQYPKLNLIALETQLRAFHLPECPWLWDVCDVSWLGMRWKDVTKCFDLTMGACVCHTRTLTPILIKGTLAVWTSKHVLLQHQTRNINVLLKLILAIIKRCPAMMLSRLLTTQITPTLLIWSGNAVVPAEGGCTAQGNYVRWS